MIRVAGSGVKDLAAPDDGVLRKQAPQKMPRVRFGKRAVNALRAVIPHVGKRPLVPRNDRVAFLLRCLHQICPLCFPAARLIAFQSAAAVSLRVRLALALDADQRENLAAVFGVSLEGGTSEFPVGGVEEEMLATPVASGGVACRALGDDLVSSSPGFQKPRDVDAWVGGGHLVVRLIVGSAWLLLLRFPFPHRELGKSKVICGAASEITFRSEKVSGAEGMNC